MRRDEKKIKNHEASSFEGALELSVNGVFIPGDKPPKIGDDVVVDDGTFGLVIGADVVGVFGPPVPLHIMRNQIHST